MRVHEASITATPCDPGLVKKRVPAELDFHERLAALRKERGLTQMALAELVEMHLCQIRRYESGQSQPALDAIRKLARALSVSAVPTTISDCSSKPLPGLIRKRKTSSAP